MIDKLNTRVDRASVSAILPTRVFAIGRLVAKTAGDILNLTLAETIKLFSDGSLTLIEPPAEPE